MQKERDQKRKINSYVYYLLWNASKTTTKSVFEKEKRTYFFISFLIDNINNEQQRVCVCVHAYASVYVHTFLFTISSSVDTWIL